MKFRFAPIYKKFLFIYCFSRVPAICSNSNSANWSKEARYRWKPKYFVIPQSLLEFRKAPRCVPSVSAYLSEFWHLNFQCLEVRRSHFSRQGKVFALFGKTSPEIGENCIVHVIFLSELSVLIWLLTVFPENSCSAHFRGLFKIGWGGFFKAAIKKKLLCLNLGEQTSELTLN